MANHFRILALSSMKRQKDRTMKDETPGVGDGQGGLAMLQSMGSQRVGHD